MRTVLVIVAAMCVAFILGRSSRVEAYESFTLGERDKVIAEAPGCHAECKILGPSNRVCTLKSFDCRALCQTLPECSAPGKAPLKVCAIVRSER